MKRLRIAGFAAALVLFSAGAFAQQPTMPDYSSWFGNPGAVNPFATAPANPFAAPQANAFTGMMAPMGMMGGTNPMVTMVNPANWMNPHAYAQFANPMAYMAMMNPFSYMAFMNPMTYLPMMNPNAYLQMMNPALGLAGVNPIGNIAAIDPNTYVQFLVQLLGGVHAGTDTSDGFLDKLKELGEQVAPTN